MTRLQIDRDSKSIFVELDLKGETAPLTIALENYRLQTEPEGVFLEIADVKTSREWLTQLCEDYAKGRRLNLTKMGVPRVVLGLL